MRRKSERNKSKSGGEKKTTDTTPRKTRRTSRRRKRSTSRSSSEDSDDAPLKPAVVETQEAEVSPPSDEPKVSGSHSNSDEDKQEEQPIWKVKTTEAPSGEIQKLKICLQRPPTTPERTEKSPRRRRGKASSQSDDASLTPEEKPHKIKTRRSSPGAQVAEGSSLENSIIEDAEKDECLIIVKETNEVMLGKGKLDSSQPSQDSENEECTQDSRTEVQADESLIESKIKQDMEQDSAPVIKDDPQEKDAEKTVDPQETVSESPVEKQIEVTEEKLVENKSEKESQIIDKDNEVVEVRDRIKLEKPTEICAQEIKKEKVQVKSEITVKSESNVEDQTTNVEESTTESTKIEMIETIAETSKTEESSKSIKKEIKPEVKNEIKQANEPVVEELKQPKSEPVTEVAESVPELKTEANDSVPEPEVPKTDTEVTESVPELKAEPVTEANDSVPEPEVIKTDTEVAETVPKPEATPVPEANDSVLEPEVLKTDTEVAETVPEPEATPVAEANDSVPEPKVLKTDTEVTESVTEPKAEPVTESNDSNEQEIQKTVTEATELVAKVEVQETTEVTEPELQKEESTESNSDIISSEVNNEKSKITEEVPDTNLVDNSIKEISTMEDEIKPEEIKHEEDKSSSNEDEKMNESSVEDNKSTSDVKDVSPEKEQDSKPKSPEPKVTSNEEKMDEDLPERISRKRNWGKYSARLKEDQPITLKLIISLFPSFKLLNVEDVKLETEELVREQKIPKKEREITVLAPVSPKEDDFEKEVSNIGLNRKISIVNDEASKLQPPPSPAKNPTSSVLYITNLVRPFTIKQLQELLSRTGKIVEDGFWTDKIKSKCYVQYETNEEAEATRNALHGVQWPTGNGKKIIIDFGTIESMAAARNAVVETVAPKPAPEKNVEKVSEYKKEEPKPEVDRWEKTRAAAPVREWDLGKVPQDHRDRSRSRERNQSRSDRERTDKKRPPRNESPSNGDHVTPRKKKKEDTEVKMMDDLFHKTKATPSIYWLPLSPDQIAKKQQQRLQRMAEHKRRMEESRRMERDFVGRGAPRPRRRSARYDGD